MILKSDTIIGSGFVAKITKLIERLDSGSRLTYSEVRQILTSQRFVLRRQKGSHEQWVKDGRTFTLACHSKDVPNYILKALRQLLREQDHEEK